MIWGPVSVSRSPAQADSLRRVHGTQCLTSTYYAPATVLRTWSVMSVSMFLAYHRHSINSLGMYALRMHVVSIYALYMHKFRSINIFVYVYVSVHAHQCFVYGMRKREATKSRKN